MKFKDLNVSFDKPYVWRKPFKDKLTKRLRYMDVIDEIQEFDKMKTESKKEILSNIDRSIDGSASKGQLSKNLSDMFEFYSKAVLMTDDYDDDFLLNKTNKNTLNKKLQPWCKNLVHNIPRVIDSPPLINLFNKFHGVPAFVVLAGPSLANNIDLLRKVRDKGIIIATDTAFRPCLEAGIQPHLVMAHDANPQGMRFFLPKEHPFQNPTIKYNDMEFEMLLRDVQPELVKGKKAKGYSYNAIGVFVDYVHPLTIEAFNGSDLCFYQVLDPSLPVYNMMGGCTNWKKEGDKFVPEKKGFVVGGSSVGHTAAYLAVNLGCSPVCILGCDLSYPGGVTYIPGASNQKDASKQRLIEVEDLSGRKVGTNLSMFSYRMVFQKVLPRIIEQTGTRFFNCTEHKDGSPAGILEVGAEPRQLKKIIDEYCKEDIPNIVNINKILRGGEIK